jgi:hypothetical protein
MAMFIVEPRLLKGRKPVEEINAWKANHFIFAPSTVFLNWGSKNCTYGVNEVSRFYSFIFYAVLLHIFIIFFYFYNGVKKNMTKKTIPSIYTLVSLYSIQSKFMRSFWGGGPRYQKGWKTLPQYMLILAHI